MESVQVAVRVRPLVPHEIGCKSCVEVIPEAHQILTKGRDARLTFDYVFDSSTPQIDVYETAIQGLVLQLFKGYNVTVIAYGQTGSGMTYSMGTCPSANPADQGIIQRAVTDMFSRIDDRDDDWIFDVSVSFLELYNEQLIDLLSKKHQNNIVDLRKSNRGIIIPGLTQKTTRTAEAVLQCLRQGSKNRTTGATAMNAQSSRSHAIFTIYIHQTRRSDESVAMSAKFHLVDLAGSGRQKKTKTEDMRFTEGVKINKAIFALGNVISSLCDSASYVNYRDSKLTRLLQDSLGGNALTLMLACVSPAESNLDETHCTLRYADRARKIKNKPVINPNPQKQEIDRLKQTAMDAHEALQAQLAEKEMLLKEIEKHKKTEFDLNEKDGEIKQLQISRRELENKLQSKCSEASSLHSQLMNLKTCIHDLEVAKKEMEAELRDKSCKIETLEETKSNIEKKLESLQQQVHDLSVKNASLEEELNKIQENEHDCFCS